MTKDTLKSLNFEEILSNFLKSFFSFKSKSKSSQTDLPSIRVEHLKIQVFNAIIKSFIFYTQIIGNTLLIGEQASWILQLRSFEEKDQGINFFDSKIFRDCNPLIIWFNISDICVSFLVWQQISFFKKNHRSKHTHYYLCN